jgi:cytochrome c
MRSAVAAFALAVIASAGLTTTSCAGSGERTDSAALAAGADRNTGRSVIIDVGCGSCHRIPGIPNAHALVGPPLDSWARRSFIAGTLPNDPVNLGRFLENPRRIRPGSAMPDLGLDEREIAHIVAYLFSLD